MMASPFNVRFKRMPLLGKSVRLNCFQPKVVAKQSTIEVNAALILHLMRSVAVPSGPGAKNHEHAASLSVRFRTVALVSFVACIFCLNTNAQRTDPNLGRNLAATCANCHGAGGDGPDQLPSLAGRRKEDLIGKLQQFKTGKLPSTVMQQLMKGYSDEEIDTLAGWFAAQPAK